MPAVKRSISFSQGTVEGTPMKRRKRVKRSSSIRASEKLGKITGVVSEGNTTLAKASGPFSARKFVTFLYENLLQQVSGAANVLVASVKPNDMFDFDNSNDFGNKQPLYYDQLLTASGPYKQYKVLSWKTTYYFANNSDATPINIWVSAPVAATSEVDSVAEVDNWPGVSRLRLTAKTGSKSYGEIVVTGHIKDVFPTYYGDNTFVGSYNGSPGTPVYQTIVIQGADGSTAPSVFMSVKHEAFTELNFVDSIVS